MFTNINIALEELMNRRRTFHPQLNKFEKCMAALGNPQNQLKVIHVAGTNGKGSTTNYIRSIAQAQGYNVGTFTSPHLVKHNDRFRINDVDISDERLLELINRSYPYWDEYDITMFEIDMLIATWYFVEEKVDLVVFEVGMGGRLDATNIVTPLASVITNISLDHTESLGDTILEIAYEKAGIIKDVGIVVTGEKDNDVLQLFRERAKREIYLTTHIQSFNAGELFYHQSLIYLKSLAKYQLKNAALAFEVCYQLDRLKMLTFDIENIVAGLENTDWKGRFEVIDRNPLTIIDGAHNEDGVKNLIESIKDLKRPLVIVFAALKDKDTKSMVLSLRKVSDQLIVTEFDFYRVLPAKAMKYDEDIIVIEDFHAAIKQGQKLAQKGTLVITGSLYFISEVRDGFNLD